MSLLDKDIQHLKHICGVILRKAGAEALRFYKQRFDEQTWVDRGSAPWRQARGRKKGRKTLIDSGALKRSIRITETQLYGLRIGTNMPYARIHNEGGIIPLTPKMRKYFFARHYAAAGKITTTKSGKVSRSRRNKFLSAEEAYFLNLAISKRKSLRIPRRQFLGASQYLENRMLRLAEATINNYLNKR